jgi:hypothetical protein
MVFIPGFLIALLTFPGVIVHEAAHQLMCRLTGTPVLQVCYFRLSTPSGFVAHDQPPSVWAHFFISVAPFLINSIVGFLIALPAALATVANSEMGPLDVLLGWLGFSVAMHAFPSTGDASSMWQALRTPGTTWLLRLIGYPVIALIYLGALLSVVWLDAIYGYAVCFGLPRSLLEILA